MTFSKVSLTSARIQLASVACGLFAAAIVGCGSGTLLPTAATHANAVKISGVVHGGQQAVTGATIQLYAAGSTGTGSAATPLLTSVVTTDGAGSFSLTGLYTCPSATTNVYLVATGGNPGLSSGQTNANLALMSALGHCGDLNANSFVSINEVTTIAAVYALAPYMNSYSRVGVATSDWQLMDNAFEAAEELANSGTGVTPGPNVVAGHVVQVNKLQTLANILSVCINTAGGVAGDNTPCGSLFSDAAVAGVTPTNTIDAFLCIALNPNQNVLSIFNLNPAIGPFQPSLQSAPQNWDLALIPPTSSLSITSAALPISTAGAAYSAQLQAVGGTPSYTWRVASGRLPDGLSLQGRTGAISGRPTTTGTSTFTVAVLDASQPTQAVSAPLSILTIAPLTITSSNLPSGTAGTAYAVSLQASGGTPSYTWSIASGSLPDGLTLGATTGALLGTPSSTGSFSFTYTVTDNASLPQTATATATITIAAAPVQSNSKTWFIRNDGGTRWSANMASGQCDGLADLAYPGVGVNQHCAYNDVRWMMWNNTYGQWQWVMAGGDTLVIRGCKATTTQASPDDPHCRIGWDSPNGNSNDNPWCWGASSCALTSVPSGTATQHTRILGGCAYDGNCNPVRGYPYSGNNLAQLFAGFSAPSLLALNGSQYVEIKGLELTTHNGQCSRFGTTHPLPGCNRGSSYPLSDQSDQGITTDNQSSHITLENLYIHGFSSAGISGPIGGPFTVTNVSIDFNTFAGWNFDDGGPTPNAPGSSITQSYLTMIGNGCQEEYPISHPQFPAKGCWDSSTGGFGDAWSGQESAMDSFTCDHCNISYNTKDGAMGPHTQITSISLTNSIWQGNMGQAGKWGQRENATFLFENNIVVGNCLRMSQPLPGAAQNFDGNTNLPGSGLSGYCRAAGALFAYFAGANSVVNFNNNTIISYQPTIWQVGCYVTGTCATSPYHFTNNLVLGYKSSYNISPFNPGQAPGLYYSDDSTVIFADSHNLQYGIKNGDSCGTNGNLCTDPQFVNEPGSFDTTENVLDNFNYHLVTTSPGRYAGVGNTSTLATDFYGNPQTSPLTIGAVSQ